MNNINNHPSKSLTANSNPAFKVGVIGGGVAGSTIAIRLASLGVETYLLESKSSLIDGPPMCHLHAGGNLYREIPDEDCVELLKQSIDMLRMYPYSIDVRPTVIAIPKRDEGDPEGLLPRLQLLTRVYSEMISKNSANKVLGEPEDYYRLYYRQDLENLIQKHNSAIEQTHETDTWVVGAAIHLDLDKLKFPIVAVAEYGWNIFRLAASAQTALNDYPNARVLLNTKVIDVEDKKSSDERQKWRINYISDVNPTEPHTVIESEKEDKTSTIHSIEVDYLVNACGFRTGVIDNMVGIPAQRMVEFKASYVTHWETMLQPNSQKNQDNYTDKPSLELESSPLQSETETKPNSNPEPKLKLPEIIIHGKRGTPNGMVQLTPYPNGYYQIHSMNKNVTLFSDGLVATTNNDAQPELKLTYLNYIDTGWNPNTLQTRSQRAIEQVSEFVPQFATARPTSNALYGGQQIPGKNDTLRVADVSLYPEICYARAENVKASSALLAADDIVAQLESQQYIKLSKANIETRLNHQWQYLEQTTKNDIDQAALVLAKQRSFPLPMSGVITPFQPNLPH